MTDQQDWEALEERLEARLRGLTAGRNGAVRIEIATDPVYVECARGDGTGIRVRICRIPGLGTDSGLASSLEAEGWSVGSRGEQVEIWRDGGASETTALASTVIGTLRRVDAMDAPRMCRISVHGFFDGSAGAAVPEQEGTDAYEAYVRALSPAAQRQEKEQVASERWFLQRAVAEIAVVNYVEHGDTPPALDTLVDLMIERGERLTPQRVIEVCDENPFMVSAIAPIARQQAAAWAAEPDSAAGQGEVNEAAASPREAVQAAKAWTKLVKVLTRAQRRLPQIPQDWLAAETSRRIQSS